MKIILKDQEEYDSFSAMLDTIVQTWDLDSVEVEFITQFQKALKEAYIDLQGRENTQGLVKKDLLID